MVKNSVRRCAKLSAILLIAIVALTSQSLVTAQTPTTEVEIVGMVTVLTAQNLTIGTQTFDITHAEIKAGVVVGALAKIHATPSTTGLWVAREVELARENITQTPSPETTPEPTPLDEFEITGQITALNLTTIVIGGHTIDISNAEIKNTPALNERVKVHVSIVNSLWVAREIEAASIPVTGAITPTLQGNDDGANHDLNDDHGGNDANDDHGNHNGADDNNNDNHGGNNGSDDNGNSGHGGGNGSGGHDHG